MWLLLPLLLLPIIEIALFITVGGAIGVLPTILLVILSAILGSWVMRRQGLAAMADLQQAVTELRDPAAPLAHGALVMLAGMLLVLPGFFTDAIGLALLMPAVRQLLIARLGRRVRVRTEGLGPGFADVRRRGPHGGPIIDADYVVVDEDMPHAAGDADRHPPRPDPGLIDNPPRSRPSGWTRH